MRYFVKARLKPGSERALLNAIQTGDLGQGSIAQDEFIHDMEEARVDSEGVAHWVETCFCATPLEEERPYWEKLQGMVVGSRSLVWTRTMFGARTGA